MSVLPPGWVVSVQKSTVGNLWLGASDGSSTVSRVLRLVDVRASWLEILSAAWSTHEGWLPPPMTPEDEASRDAFYRAERARGGS